MNRTSQAPFAEHRIAIETESGAGKRAAWTFPKENRRKRVLRKTSNSFRRHRSTIFLILGTVSAPNGAKSLVNSVLARHRSMIKSGAFVSHR
jgi:hypothetical protein